MFEKKHVSGLLLGSLLLSIFLPLTVLANEPTPILVDPIMVEPVEVEPKPVLYDGVRLRDFDGALTDRQLAPQPLVHTLLVRWGNLKHEVDFTSEGNALAYTGDIVITGVDRSHVRPVAFDPRDSFDPETLTFEGFVRPSFDGLIVKAQAGENLEMIITLNDLEKVVSSREDMGMTELGDGYYFEIKPLGNRLRPLADGDRDGADNLQVRVIEKLAKVRRTKAQLSSQCREIFAELEDYPLVPEVLEGAEFIALELELTHIESATTLTEEDCLGLRDRLHALKEKARKFKYDKGLLDFKDVDDAQWYSGFVRDVKGLALVEGYKNEDGTPTGEFGFGNNITIGELLKVSALSADNEGEDGETTNIDARKHWAVRFLKAAENRDLSIAREVGLDLNRPATRGEVLRVLLEFYFGKDEIAEANDECSYKDLAGEHPHFMPICVATTLGLVSGDDVAEGETPTFRPNAPVSRAEIAKILVKFAELRDSQ